MEEELARALDKVLILSGGDVQRGEFAGSTLRVEMFDSHQRPKCHGSNFSRPVSL